jgi:hypothetical protein
VAQAPDVSAQSDTSPQLAAISVPQAHNKQSDTGFVHKDVHPLSFVYEISDLQNQKSYKF